VFRGSAYFDAQFSTSVIGGGAASSTRLLIRKR
jgi:hypothetical protein